MIEKNKNRRVDLFLTEFLPPIVITAVSLIIFLVLMLIKATFAATSQIFLYIIICWLPAFFFVISAFKLRLPPAIKIGFYAFATCSNLLATTFNLYTYLPVFDTILHSLFGYVGGYLFMFVFIRSGDYPKFSLFARVLIMFIATVGAGLLWEICEYCVDIFTNANSQHSIETGLLDTMQDSFCNVGGAAFFAVHYLLDHLFFSGRYFRIIERWLAYYNLKDPISAPDLHGSPAPVITDEQKEV